MEKEKQIMRTELFTEKGRFFVSTLYRRSSAMLVGENWYYESFGWSCNEDGSKNKWIADNSGAENEVMAIAQHMEICEQFILTGDFKQKD